MWLALFKYTRRNYINQRSFLTCQTVIHRALNIASACYWLTGNRGAMIYCYRLARSKLGRLQRGKVFVGTSNNMHLKGFIILLI